MEWKVGLGCLGVSGVVVGQVQWITVLYKIIFTGYDIGSTCDGL